MIPPNQPWTIDQARADLLLPRRIDESVAHLRSLDRDTLGVAVGEPSALHRMLYHDLTPHEHPEFAGNYRGSAFPALRRCLVASAFSATEGTRLLMPPDRVAQYMAAYARLITRGLTANRGPSPQTVEWLASVTIVFGKVHPFLDGNGHIQRLTFQILAERTGYRISSQWRVHPKPYGEAIDRVKASGDESAGIGARGLPRSKLSRCPSAARHVYHSPRTITSTEVAR